MTKLGTFYFVVLEKFLSVDFGWKLVVYFLSLLIELTLFLMALIFEVLKKLVTRKAVCF